MLILGLDSVVISEACTESFPEQVMLKDNRMGILPTIFSSKFIVSGILGYSLTHQHIPPL